MFTPESIEDHSEREKIMELIVESPELASAVRLPWPAQPRTGTAAQHPASARRRHEAPQPRKERAESSCV